MIHINNKGITLVQNLSYMFKQDQLNVLKKMFQNAQDNFHIYMIGRRPLIMFDPSSYDVENGIFKGFISIAHENSFKKIEVVVPFGDEILRVQFENNDQYLIIECLNIPTFKVHAAFILQHFVSQNNLNAWVLDLEVLYIGRSFGSTEKSSRNVFDRLEKHEKAQKIYSENKWDKDIWLTAWRFEPSSLAYFHPEGSDIDLKNYIHDFIESKRTTSPFLQLSDKQNVCLAEAALINYFKPHYNKEFKNTFPSRNHSDYNECYELNLDYIVVELDTTAFGYKLWSPTIEAGNEHMIKYTFDSKKRFEDLFNL